jgi:hypothetical protein
MKIKREEVSSYNLMFIGLRDAKIVEPSSNGGTVKYYHFLKKNSDIFASEAKKIKSFSEPTVGYDKYLKERETLNIEYSDKDKNNNPVITDNKYQITKDEAKKTEYDLKMKDLLTKYDKEIKEYEAKLKDVQDRILKEEIDVEVKGIFTGDIPEKVTLTKKVGEVEEVKDITRDLVEALDPFIRD